VKIWEKIWKKPKYIAIAIVVFWLLIVSINFNKVLNVFDFVSEEGTNVSTTSSTESKIGLDILGRFSEVNSTFQLIIHNPNCSIITEEAKHTITQIINNITYNQKIGPYLSPHSPYSSLFDDADDILRMIFSLQWYATQMGFAAIHYIWAGIEYFIVEWIDAYNVTADIQQASTVSEQLTTNYVIQLLQNNNESRYSTDAETFINSFTKSFTYHANINLPNTTSEAMNISKTIVVSNETLFRSFSIDNRQYELLIAISSYFNGSNWSNQDYSFERITKFLFNVNDTSSIDFVKEVFSGGDIEGFVRAKNKYLIPILRKEVSVPSLSEKIVDAFLMQYTNYQEDIESTDTTIITFNLALDHVTESGKGAYLELIRIIPIFQETFSHMEIYITGIDYYVIEISLDYENQLRRTDLIVIITIIVILLLVYRSPILPLIQIFVLAIAFCVSRIFFIGVGNLVGGLASTSLIILSVSLLGSTTDYCVFLIGDYLLNLKKHKQKIPALKATLNRTARSIMISSMALTVGFGALIFSGFPTATGLGIGGALGFLTGMIVSLTLVPSILVLVSDKILIKWKLDLEKFKVPKLSINKALRKVVNNPKKVLAISIIVAAIGTGIFFIVPLDYAQITTAPSFYQSRQGVDAINQHMGTEYISQIMIVFQTPETDPFILENGSLNFESVNHVLDIVNNATVQADVTTVIGLSHPLGESYIESFQNTSFFLKEEIYMLMKNFVMAEETIAIVVFGSQYKEGEELLDDQIVTIRESIEERKEIMNLDQWNAYVTGFAPRLYDTKVEIANIFKLIFALTSLAIVVLLFIFLRKFFMSLRVLVTILISLGLSLGIFAIFSLIFFNGLIYWIVPLMLFGVLTALGLDFDVLFLGVFIHIKKEGKDSKSSIVESVEQTMNNISIAGLIMAATYLSLLFTSSIQMQQLGLGLGIGILIDVFVSRIFIVPPAVIITFRENRIKKKTKSTSEGESNEE